MPRISPSRISNEMPSGAGFALDHDIRNLQDGRPGMGLALLDGQLDLLAHHHRREASRRALGGRHRADDAAIPENCDSVRDLEDLVQLVGDEDHRAA